MSREAQKYYIQSKFGVDRSLLDRVERVAESCRTLGQIQVAKKYACLAVKRIVDDMKGKFDSHGWPTNKYISFCNEYNDFMRELFGIKLDCQDKHLWPRV